MSIFGCLVDCARFDPLSECTGLGTDGRSHQCRRSWDHKDEAQVGERYNVSSQDDHKLPAKSLYSRLCKGHANERSSGSLTERSDMEQESFGDPQSFPDSDATQRVSEASSSDPERSPNGKLGAEDAPNYATVDRSSLPTLRSVKVARHRMQTTRRHSKRSPRNSSGEEAHAESTAVLKDPDRLGRLGRESGEAGKSGVAGGRGRRGRTGRTARKSSQDSTGEATASAPVKATSASENTLLTPSRPPRGGRRVAVRSSSLGMVCSDLHRRDREKAFRTVPGGRDIRPASTPGTPGRAQLQGSRSMSRRVVAKWDDREEEEVDNPPATPERPRRFVSTSVRRLRMSDDGSTVRVTSDKGEVNHELVLSDLLEVHGTPSRKRVLLRGKDLELQIAFDGENAAFDQFRDALIVPDSGVEAGAEGEAVVGEDVAAKAEDQASSHEADCGLTESPSSGLPSGSSSERVDAELEDECSVGTHLTPRSSVSNYSSRGGASCASTSVSVSVSCVGYDSLPEEGDSSPYGDQKPNSDNVEGGRERVLSSSSTSTSGSSRRHRMKYGNLSPTALAPHRKGPEGETFCDVAEETASVASRGSAPRKSLESTRRAPGGRTVNSVRMSGNTSEVQGGLSGGNFDAHHEVGEEMVRRLSAKLSVRNTNRLHEPMNGRADIVQHAGVVE